MDNNNTRWKAASEDLSHIEAPLHPLPIDKTRSAPVISENEEQKVTPMAAKSDYVSMRPKGYSFDGNDDDDEDGNGSDDSKNDCKNTKGTTPRDSTIMSPSAASTSVQTTQEIYRIDQPMLHGFTEGQINFYPT